MTPCYIFDIDGTLANGDHRLHHIKKEPKNWAAYFAACSEDAPIQHVIDICRSIGLSDYPLNFAIVYVSGRSDECRRDTQEWLNRHHLPTGPVYMRQQGDHRPDDILKIELLAHLREDGFEPIMAFDDRNRVVEAWRAAGVPCAQVAPGDF